MVYNKKAIKKYQANHPERVKIHRRKRALSRYGLTLADYDRILAGQEGACAICYTDTPGGPGGRFAVDHDHATGVVRGLLCSRCNFVLGYAKEDPDVLSRAIQYLREHRA